MLKNYLSPQALKSLETEQATRLSTQALSTPGLLKNREYRAFQARYRDDTVAFAMDCIDWKDSDGLTHYQEQILGDFQVYDRQAVRGPRGLGKTTMAAIDTLGWALTHDGEDWKVGQGRASVNWPPPSGFAAWDLGSRRSARLEKTRDQAA